MVEETILKHVALQYSDKEKADIFFLKILGLQLKKTFTISKNLTFEIFGIKKDILIIVYENENTCFEIFITNKKNESNFEHTCIQINNKEEFIERCKKYGIKPLLVKKGEKTLHFIKDFAGNIFEIKEKV